MVGGRFRPEPMKLELILPTRPVYRKSRYIEGHISPKVRLIQDVTDADGVARIEGC